MVIMTVTINRVGITTTAIDGPGEACFGASFTDFARVL